MQPIAVKWVPANVQTRLDTVRKGQADMECGTTTITLSRMEKVDFSNMVWVDATGLIVRKSAGAKTLGGLAGKSIAVVADTPNAQALQEALKKGLVSATQQLPGVIEAGDAERSSVALQDPDGSLSGPDRPWSSSRRRLDGSGSGRRSRRRRGRLLAGGRWSGRG